MSLFFNKINKTFKNQNYSSQYFKKQGIRYIDKTFNFPKNSTANHCLFSNNDFKTFDLFNDIYGLYQYWIEHDFVDKNFNEDEADLQRAYDICQTNTGLKNLVGTSFNYWKINWKNILKNNINDLTYEPEYIYKIIYYKKYTSSNIILSQYNNTFEWESIANISHKENFKIFENEINCTNVKQGYLGTCYFLEAVSTLSNYGQLLYQLFPNEDLKKKGIYEICLFYKGQWQKVLVDDYFLFLKNKKNEDGSLKRYAERFAFAQPIETNGNYCLYSCLLEKAYAKLLGSYADINGGEIEKAYHVLTGFGSVIFENKKLNNKMHNYLYNKYREGFLLACNTSNHAYSIISMVNNKIQIRNPWGSIDTKEKEMFKEFIKKNNYYMGSINDTRLKKYLEKNNGLFFVDINQFKNYFIETLICQILFNSTVYSFKLENNILLKDHYLYFRFDIFEQSKISIGIFGEDDTPFFQNVNFKLINMRNNKEENLEKINTIKDELDKYFNNYNQFQYDMYKIIYKSRFLLKVDLTNIYDDTFANIKGKIIKIIVGGNINIDFLGYHKKQPNFYAMPKQITNFDIYNYGHNTGLLFKKFPNIIKILEKAFNIKMHPDAKGYYIETIFTDEIKTLIRFSKKEKIEQICSYQENQDIYFTGNAHYKGKIEGQGKSMKIYGNNIITLKQGKIHQNKICICEFFDLNDQENKSCLKIPNIFKFEENAYIKTILHEHDLFYKLSKRNWECNFCLQKYFSFIGLFSCEKCNYKLCINCLDINDEKIKIYENLIQKFDKINLKINKKNLSIKSSYHEHELFYKIPYSNNSFICDICNKNYYDIKSFHCARCGFDVCLDCISTQKKILNSKNIKQFLCAICLEKIWHYGFISKIRYKNENIFCLFTYNKNIASTITYSFFDIYIKLNSDNKDENTKEIRLNSQRKIWKNNELICLEILEEDNILSLLDEPFEIDINCYREENNNNFSGLNYEQKNIIIPLIKSKNELELLKGKLGKIFFNNNEFEIKDCDSKNIFIGCPIFSEETSTIIGLYTGTNNNNLYLGTYLKYLFNNNIIQNNEIKIKLNKNCQVFYKFFTFFGPLRLIVELKESLYGNIIKRKEFSFPNIVNNYGIAPIKFKYSNNIIFELKNFICKNDVFYIDFFKFAACVKPFMWSFDEKEKKIILLKKDLYRNPQTFYYGDNFSPGTFPIKLGTNINGFTAFLGKFDYDEKNNEITIGVPNDRAIGDIRFLLKMVDIPMTFMKLFPMQSRKTA